MAGFKGGQNLLRDRSADKESVKYQPLREQTIGQWWASGKVKELWKGLSRDKLRRRALKTSQGNLGGQNSALRFI